MDTISLGQRLRQAGVPVLLDGACTVNESGQRGRVVSAGGGEWLVSRQGFVLTFADVPGEHLDLTDGATRGAVLAWLRETYGQFNLCPRFINTSSTSLSWWCFSPSVESLDDLPHADSEAEALVVAAEWLREGRWSARHPRSWSRSRRFIGG
jgi:hypothetical protein